MIIRTLKYRSPFGKIPIETNHVIGHEAIAELTSLMHRYLKQAKLGAKSNQEILNNFYKMVDELKNPSTKEFSQAARNTAQDLYDYLKKEMGSRQIVDDRELQW